MKRPFEIIVHPGAAHRDDFLSVCVLLASQDISSVIRREVDSKDLNDPYTFVVDVGREYDVHSLNFDHHQGDLPCSFHLVMEWLGLHTAAKEIYPWYNFTSELDTTGPIAVAKSRNIDPKYTLEFMSPIEDILLDMFSQTVVVPEDLQKIMRHIGWKIIQNLEAAEKRLLLLEETAYIMEIKKLRGLVSFIKEDPQLALGLFKRRKGNNFAWCISPAERTSGWALYRFDDHSKVNFLPIKGKEGIHFVHNTGFLAITEERIPLDDVLNLLKLCITE